jgi:hypothetical protein
MVKRKPMTPEKKWLMRVKKMPDNEHTLTKLHKMYEENWWHLTRSYRGRKGKKYQKRENVLDDKEVKIRKKLGLDAEPLEDCHFGSYDRFLLSRLIDCYTSRKSNRNHLTKVDSCDILCNESGIGGSGEDEQQ